jgi:short-subunit dehydrogenase
VENTIIFHSNDQVVNVEGVMILTNLAAKQMIKQGQGGAVAGGVSARA